MSTAFVVGKKYFVRTATYHVVGKLTEIHDNELVFEAMDEKIEEKDMKMKKKSGLTNDTLS